MLYLININDNLKSIKKFTIMMDNLIYLFNNLDKNIKIKIDFNCYKFIWKDEILFKFPKNIIFIYSFYVEINEETINFEAIKEEIELIFHIFKEFFPYNFFIKNLDKNNKIIDFKFDSNYLIKSYLADILNNIEKNRFIDDLLVNDLKIQLDLFIENKNERGINLVLQYINNSNYLNYEVLEINLKEILNKIRSNTFISSQSLKLADDIINKIKKNELKKYENNKDYEILDMEKLLEEKNLKNKNKDYLLFVLKESNDFDLISLIFYIINKDDNDILLDKDELNFYIKEFFDKYFKHFYEIKNKYFIEKLSIHLIIMQLISKNDIDIKNEPNILYGLFALIDKIISTIIIQNLNYNYNDFSEIIELIKYFINDCDCFENNDKKLKILEKLKLNIEYKIKGEKFEIWDKDFFLNIIGKKIKEIYELIVEKIN